MKKIKTVLLSVKAPVEKAMKIGLVYQISWSRCQSGANNQTFLTRVKEHRSIGTPVRNHFKGCGATSILITDDVKVIISQPNRYII